jgi:hypothetical protein
MRRGRAPVKLSYEIVGDVLVIDTREAFEACDVDEVLTEALSNPKIQWPLKTLFIHRGGLFNPTTDELRGLIEKVAQFRDRITRFAIVVEEDFHFGLGRMSEALSESVGYPLRAFRSDDEAREWLHRASP